jgi:hypothetical protein
MMGRKLLSLLFVLLSSVVIAQNASVRAEKYRMRIGEQIELLLKAEAHRPEDLVLFKPMTGWVKFNLMVQMEVHL